MQKTDDLRCAVLHRVRPLRLQHGFSFRAVIRQHNGKRGGSFFALSHSADTARFKKAGGLRFQRVARGQKGKREARDGGGSTQRANRRAEQHVASGKIS